MFSELPESEQIKILIKHNRGLLNTISDFEEKLKQISEEYNKYKQMYSKLAEENVKRQSKLIKLQHKFDMINIRGNQKKRYEVMKRFLIDKQLVDEFVSYYKLNKNKFDKYDIEDFNLE